MNKLEELNFDVVKEPISIAKTGEVIEGKFAIARKDTNKVLGIVSKDYRIIKHGEAMHAPAEILLSEGYEVKSSYVSGYGAKAILEMLSKDAVKINGEDYKTRIHLLNSYDGSTSLRVEFGFFRLTCLNGAGYAAKEKDVSSIAHIGKDRLFDKDIVMNFLGARTKYIKSFSEIVKKLADFKITTDDDAVKFLNRLEFGKRTVKNIIEEWKKDINYSPNLSGVYNGITSLFSRKTEAVDKSGAGIGNRVMHAQWQTNRSLHLLSQIASEK